MDNQSIQEQINLLKNKPQLSRRERRYLAKLERKLQGEQKPNTFNWKDIATKIVVILLVVTFIGGIVWYIKSQPTLPPIDIEGHVEQSPPSHISDQEMPEPIQKHMLEHADGEGKPGILIQYNCKKYNCEKNMVDKLRRLVKKYPENGYLARGNYDGKIVLTKLGKREILDSFAEKRITDFISQ